jgi:hypothetical protein
MNTSSTLETWCTTNMPGYTPYVNHDDFNLTLKYLTTFVFLVRARFNKTQCWDGSKFIGSSCRCKMTVSGCGITLANVTLTNAVSQNNSGQNYIWINFYYTNAGAGFQLPKFCGNSGIAECKITQIWIECLY